MIAIDTNVLLRYLLADDALQFKKAKKLIENSQSVLLADVVLVETVWTLTGKRYGFDKDTICGLARALVADGAFIFEDIQVIWSSLMDYKYSRTVSGKRLDFADALIANTSHAVAEQKCYKLSGFFSFDKALGQLHGCKGVT